MQNKICHCCSEPITDNYKFLCKACREGSPWIGNPDHMPTNTEQQLAEYFDKLRTDYVANILTR